jgi:hypothetical protein
MTFRNEAFKKQFDQKIEETKTFLKQLTDAQRLLFWRETQEEYCDKCGSNDLPCHCDNDE